MSETDEKQSLIRRFIRAYTRLLADAPEEPGESLVDIIAGLEKHRISSIALANKVIRELKNELSYRHGECASSG